MIAFAALLDYWHGQERPRSGSEAAFNDLLDLLSIDLPGNDDGWLLMLLAFGSLVLGAVMVAALVDGMAERRHTARTRHRHPA